MLDPLPVKLADAGLRRLGIEDVDELVPGGIAVSKSAQIGLQPVLQLALSHALLQLAHHDGSLVIDDVAIEQTGLVEVGQRLLDGVGAA